MSSRRGAPEGTVPTLLTETDLHFFNEGTHGRLYEKMGAHPTSFGGQSGTSFAVWAPGARCVSVIGDFNSWDAAANPLQPRGTSGIWEAFVAGVGDGATYKYHVTSQDGDHRVEKADPVGFRHEVAPRTASIVCQLDGYAWQDDEWMRSRGPRIALDAPICVYEVHLGSWRRDPSNPERLLGYREIAPALAEYVVEMGFTHIELMPITEHPFYGSWGYQTTGYFAPTSRYGPPEDFMHLVDLLHRSGVGIILDWVPSHFPTDEHGLGYFDGTHLYEHSDPRQGFHPDWSSFIFNYGRHEVRSFLLSSALFWLDRYHVDGLRVDAVASMLYLDYSRAEGEWIPNLYGGRENIEATSFLRRLNEEVYRVHPAVQTIAEESTAWPMVSRPTSAGGLGFGLKWDMGWMHDTLQYIGRDPVHRAYHHDELTFRMIYAFRENFVLPLSHDEVVHGKGSLLGRMPGDTWQRFANLRLLFGYQYAQPGKKLLFMGCELAQQREWTHDTSLDWHLLREPRHAGMQRWVRDLNHVYREQGALHELDTESTGFTWLEANDAKHSTYAFLRWNRARNEAIFICCNCTPLPRNDTRIGVPWPGDWVELLNSDAAIYGGSGVGNPGVVRSDPIAWHEQQQSVTLTLPPLAVVMFKGTAE